jgi:single-strand DNA-binding protein
MTYLNKVELKGFLGADAEAKNLDGGKTVLNLSIATKVFFGQGERQERTEWHRVTAWGKVAASAPQLSKGAYVHVVGQLRGREYTNAEGTKVQTYDIVAGKIETLPREKQEASN